MHVKYCYINNYEVCVAVSQFSVWPEASAASSDVVATLVSFGSGCAVSWHLVL